MTPEEAQELLDNTTPGCWEFNENAELEYPAGPMYGPVIGYEEHFVTAKGSRLFGMANDRVILDYPGNLRLAAAAPALAEIVAGLRYEYAAQVRRGPASPWLYVLQSGHFSKRGSTSVWCKRRSGCENPIRSALKRKDVGADTVEFRIVRRLVSEPEVVE